MMKERPILFNAEMVRAVLDLRKTQTRRVLDMKKYGGYLQETDTAPGNPAYPCYQDEYGDSHPTASKCPYGKKGDRLWVRESFWEYGSYVKTGEDTKAGRARVKFEPLPCDDGNHGIIYCADQSLPCAPPPDRSHVGWHKRPSIFLPREFSRINLEITDRRVERVQDISEADAEAEGVEPSNSLSAIDDDGNPVHHIASYMHLWNSINFKRGFGWDVNPWVWVVEFRVI